jgi:hypothetical protein
MIYLRMILKKFFLKAFLFTLLIIPTNIIGQIVINEISAHKGYLDEYGENTGLDRNYQYSKYII